MPLTADDKTLNSYCPLTLRHVRLMTHIQLAFHAYGVQYSKLTKPTTHSTSHDVIDRASRGVARERGAASALMSVPLAPRRPWCPPARLHVLAVAHWPSVCPVSRSG